MECLILKSLEARSPFKSFSRFYIQYLNLKLSNQKDYPVLSQSCSDLGNENTGTSACFGAHHNGIAGPRLFHLCYKAQCGQGCSLALFSVKKCLMFIVFTFFSKTGYVHPNYPKLYHSKGSLHTGSLLVECNINFSLE